MMYYSENGDELKRFDTHDGKCLELLLKSGIMTAILTSENRELNAHRAEKLQINFLRQGVSDKLSEMIEICASLGINLENVAYIGDDLNDLKLLENSGLSACPANAVDEIKAISGILKLTHEGGHGAVREFCDYILSH